MGALKPSLILSFLLPLGPLAHSSFAANLGPSHFLSHPSLQIPALASLDIKNPALDSSSPLENVLPSQDETLEKMAGLKLLKGSKTQETRLKEVIALARTTPTGREILKKMKELSSRTGNYPVVFSSLGKNLGQYDYTSQTLELNRQFLNEDTRLSVSTLIHEMTHILQHSKNIPAESLEMELEAYLVHIKTLRELRMPVKDWDPFSRQAFKLIKSGPSRYIDWMAEQHPGKFLLKNGNAEELAELQEQEFERQEKLINHLNWRIKRNQKNIALKKKKKRAQIILSWIERDIALLRSPKALARYRRFSKRVHSLLKRLSDRL
jgi:hypothetical protein